MFAINNFKSVIIKWLCEHDFSNLEIDFANDFGYINTDDLKCINIGIIPHPIEGNYFEQFLYEYGCDYVDIPYQILCFLHELGHYNTVTNFSDEELWTYYFIKDIDEARISQEEYFKYWEIPDEFAANIWVINYINTHIEAVEELTQKYIIAWNQLIQSNELTDYIEE